VRFCDWRRGDQRYFVSNIGRLAAAIDWQPRVSVEEGLWRLHAWLAEAFAPPRRVDDVDAITVAVTPPRPVIAASSAVGAEPRAS
jgi:dTDP-D-glucose 4,6-dehydratase